MDMSKKLRRIHFESGELELPEDIIREILLHLTAGDLQIYKSVSESWKSLISRPDFGSAHFIRSQSPQHYDHQKEQVLLLETAINRQNSIDSYCEYHQYAIHNNLTTAKQLQLRLPPQEPNTTEQIPSMLSNLLSLKASCDGLLLFENRYYLGHLYIINPLTAHSYHINPPYSVYDSTRMWALVRDTSINRYKLFGLRSYTIYSMLTLGDAIAYWTLCKHHPPNRRKNIILSQPFLFQKELHWLTVDEEAPDDHNSTLCYYLYSVHVETLTLTRTMLPPHLLNGDISEAFDFEKAERLHLLSETNAGESLCLTFVSRSHLQMFVLEDKLNSVWTKSHRVRLQSLSNLPHFFRSFLSDQTCLVITNRQRQGGDPDAIGNNDLLDLVKVILHHGDQLFLYDLKTQQTRPLGFLSKERKLLKSYCFHSHSLLSPSCSSS